MRVVGGCYNDLRTLTAPRKTTSRKSLYLVLPLAVSSGRASGVVRCAPSLKRQYQTKKHIALRNFGRGSLRPFIEARTFCRWCICAKLLRAWFAAPLH